jgi:alkaline phosphatase D
MMNRRKLLQTLAAGIGSPFLVTWAQAADWSPGTLPIDANLLSRDSARVFDLSVSSADPTPGGVVLWTHIAPGAWKSTEPLYLQVARDAAFADLVLQARVEPSRIGASADYTVKLDLDGHLAPATTYWYRFVYDATVSRTGRARTAPAAGTQAARLKFGLLTCQDYTNGYYGALARLAQDDSLDAVLHLGDFIYETAGDPRFQSLPYADRTLVLPSGGLVSLGLQDYRFIYRTYRADPYLQAAMERHTFICIPDDHETSNDCYWDYARDTLGAPDHPFTTDTQYGNDPALLRRLKLDAQRAWSEYVPARVALNEGATHPHDFLRQYRRFAFGGLLDLFMIENRSYRSAHPCGEGDALQRYLPLGCTNYNDANRTMLGAAQLNWLTEGLASSRATWKLMGNQTLFGQLSLTFLGTNLSPINVDAWDGYAAERRRIADVLREAKVKNFVVATGDLHTYIAAQVKRDYGNLNPFDTGNQLGVEFMTPAVTSSNIGEMLSQGMTTDQKTRLINGLSKAAVQLNNPHIKFFDSTRHGYSTLEFTPTWVEWVAYAVAKNVDSGDLLRSCIARQRKSTLLPWLMALSTDGY